MHNTRFDWLGLAYVFVYPMPVACGWIGQREIYEKYDEGYWREVSVL